MDIIFLWDIFKQVHKTASCGFTCNWVRFENKTNGVLNIPRVSLISRSFTEPALL